MRVNQFEFDTTTLVGVCLNWIIGKFDRSAVISHRDDAQVTVNGIALVLTSQQTAIPDIWKRVVPQDELPLLLVQLDDVLGARINIECTEAILEYVIHTNQLDMFGNRTLEYRTKMFDILMRTWHYRQQAAVNIGSILFGDKVRTITDAVLSKRVYCVGIGTYTNVIVLPIRFAEFAVSWLVERNSGIGPISGMVISPAVSGHYITLMGANVLTAAALNDFYRGCGKAINGRGVCYYIDTPFEFLP